MNNNLRKRIKKNVEELLKENHIRVAPVPVEQIAKSLRVRIRYSPLDRELSGIIFVQNGKPIIGVNSLHHPNRQRFTIAHEIGHLRLHQEAIVNKVHVDKAFPMLMRNSKSATGENSMEIEANYFAAVLLMPEQLIANSLGDEPFDIDDDSAITSLAKEFKVSLSALRFRLGNLLH